MHLRSRLATCSLQEANQRNITLATPLATLFLKIPPPKDMPHTLTENTAKLQLVEQLSFQKAQIIATRYNRD